MTMRAIVRGVPGSFARALAAAPADPPIDVGRARAQHDAYVEALGAIGVEALVLSPDDACPDCCFVEDTCVIAGEVALVTRPGAPSRRAEVEPVAATVGRFRRIARMDACEPGSASPDATLDGGDCLRLGRTFYVGRSARTNDAGIARLRAVVAPEGYDVVPVEMPAGVLHLKSVCSALSDDVVLVAEATLPPTTFGAARVIITPQSEPHAANVVAVSGAVLVSADAPRTRVLVERSGARVVPVDTSELRKADGALTCLSVLLPREV